MLREFAPFLVIGSVLLSGCATERVEPKPLDRETIRVTVASHLKEMQRCYEEALEKRPGAEGKITVSWTILDDGSVEGVKIKEIGKKMLEAKDCALTTVRGWKFPRQPESHVTDVDYPFFFSENGHYEGFSPSEQSNPVGLTVPGKQKD